MQIQVVTSGSYSFPTMKKSTNLKAPNSQVPNVDRLLNKIKLYDSNKWSTQLTYNFQNLLPKTCV